MKYIIVLLLFGLLFVFSFCPKKGNNPVPQLPSITQTGMGTFGCLVNGQVWLPGGVPPWVVPYYNQGQLTIGAHKTIYNSSNQEIGNQNLVLSLQPISDTGKYYLNNSHYGASYDQYVINYNDSLQNWVHITKFDLIQPIVSGTFNLYFTAPGKDTIRITNGRFDLMYSD